MSPRSLRQLQRLAQSQGVQISYIDIAGHPQFARPETLQAILRAMGVPIDQASDIPDAWRQARLDRWHTVLEPVSVAWGRRKTRVAVRLSAALDHRRLEACIRCEDGRGVSVPLSPKTFSASTSAHVEQTSFQLFRLELPTLDPGYHQLELKSPSGSFHSLIIAAPEDCFVDPDWEKAWGIFLPVYAAQSARSWGAGNLNDWKRLIDWTASLGGQVAATLPLMAGFLGGPVCEPSPYSPASRLFWNEFYLDIDSIPELSGCAPARDFIRSSGFRKKLAQFRQNKEVDYRAQMPVRRQVLELLAESLVSCPTPRRTAFREYLRRRPEADVYARFRAAHEKMGCAWPQWPERLRNGGLKPGDYSKRAWQYHAYVQWLAQEQFQEVREQSRRQRVKLYLDLPLGVHPDGFDVWKHQRAFALEAGTGAPPDPFFSKGQDWGFSPLHPQAIREQRYRYVVDYLRFQMAQTDLLRIDHVMGLHRLYWVPKGFRPDEGAYVRYRADELYAILCLESHRHRTILVGENLGTVPAEVNAAMRRRKLRGMFVLQFEEQPKPLEALPPPSLASVASLNTHDMPTFAAHWEGRDIVDRVKLGLISKDDARAEQSRRKTMNAALVAFLRREGCLKRGKPDTGVVLAGCLNWLGSSPAETLLINLEDLWLETKPQNVPGTSSERPNWKRKARLRLEQIERHPVIAEMLKRISKLRHEAGLSGAPGGPKERQEGRGGIRRSGKSR